MHEYVFVRTNLPVSLLMGFNWRHLDAAFVFSLMWAMRTLELRFLATLKSNMPHVSVTLATCHTPKCLLSAMIYHLLTINSYSANNGSWKSISVALRYSLSECWLLQLLKFAFFQFCNTQWNSSVSKLFYFCIPICGETYVIYLHDKITHKNEKKLVRKPDKANLHPHFVHSSYVSYY